MALEMVEPGGLVLYKKRPARVLHVADKITIELPDGNHAKVRSKDIVLLHPGPLDSLKDLASNLFDHDDVQLAWQILCEFDAEHHELAELAELIYGEFTPSSAWSAWEHLDDGLYFQGTVDRITPRSLEQIRAEQQTRRERQARAQAWIDFIDRAHRGAIDIHLDEQFLGEVADLALGRVEESRVLRELGHSERPESAHALLLACGYWDMTIVPYPTRMRLPAHPPQIDLPALPEEPRLDLTHLEAYAIDDRDNQDPDDAISLDHCELDHNGRFVGGRIWVHVADASALVPPNTPADLEARARGATLYLPDGAIPMLPLAAIDKLGLGLQEVSPALSFGLQMNQKGEIVDTQIQPSWVRVKRMSYQTVEQALEAEPFQSLLTLTEVYQARRRANGALFIDLPETIMHLVDGKVVIRPVRRLRSRDMVREAMLMVGEACAWFAVQHDIPLPYATQEPSRLDSHSLEEFADPSLESDPKTHPSLACSYAIRRSLSRSQMSGYPAPHAGVGLPMYSRATSPLRRYLDLVVHQQLRAFLRGDALLTQEQVFQRLGETEAVLRNVNLAEALGRRHWTLVYLLQNPGWQGEGILVDLQDLRARVIIPDLAFEVPLHLRQDMPLDSRIQLQFKGANLPYLEAHFVLI